MQDSAAKPETNEINLAVDIKWLAQAEPLMLDSRCENIFSRQEFEHIPDRLVHYPHPPAYRLGRQFEDTLEYLIEVSQQKQLLARNFVVSENKITLGELDAIYTEQEQNVHLEAAIKFYLYRPEQSKSLKLSDFIGPNPIDRLDMKYDRLRQHQLPILHHSATQDTLTAAKIDKPTEQKMLLTGILFYPLSAVQPSDKALQDIGINPKHQRGWWVHQSQVKNLKDHFPDKKFIILPRWHWIAGVEHQACAARYPLDLLTAEQLDEVQQQAREHLMIAVVEEDSSTNATAVWKELSRGMIVSDNWPNALKR